MVSIKRTRQAEIDLLEIWRFIAEENPVAADNLVRKLDQRSLALLEQPKMGMVRPDVAKDMRQLLVGNYLILYRILGHDIEIVRYLHGARDLFSI